MPPPPLNYCSLHVTNRRSTHHTSRREFLRLPCGQPRRDCGLRLVGDGARLFPPRNDRRVHDDLDLAGVQLALLAARHDVAGAEDGDRHDGGSRLGGDGERPLFELLQLSIDGAGALREDRERRPVLDELAAGLHELPEPRRIFSVQRDVPCMCTAACFAEQQERPWLIRELRSMRPRTGAVLVCVDDGGAAPGQQRMAAATADQLSIIGGAAMKVLVCHSSQVALLCLVKHAWCMCVRAAGFGQT